MCDVENALPLAERVELRKTISETDNLFLKALPKIELHVHIEGIITPALKWKFSKRNGMTLAHPRTGTVFSTLDEYEDYHGDTKPSDGRRMRNDEETLSFFEAYYGGFEVLKKEEDYYDLAMHYFEHASAMNVRYCEVFFDPQGHTRVGTKWETMMNGFRRAQAAAERELNVKSAWIMCILRDLSPESAMEHYLAAIDYRDMIVGIGLDSNEAQRPPILFDEVFTRARADGFRITAHCDVGSGYPLENVHQVLSVIGRSGADRIDHGLNAAGSAELVKSIAGKAIGMTICPWSYIRHQPLEEVFQRIRTLFDAGVKLAIASDDPAFMENTWILENLLVVRMFCNFTNEDMLKLASDAVEMCWAAKHIKEEIKQELTVFAASHALVSERI